MSNQDQPINFGADATENNLAGTRDEFNDEVTAQLLDEARSKEEKESEENKNEESDGGQAEEREEREEQPALEVDEESPASEAKPSS